jgi:broad specificity phosphatase PhoE
MSGGVVGHSLSVGLTSRHTNGPSTAVGPIRQRRGSLWSYNPDGPSHPRSPWSRGKGASANEKIRGGLDVPLDENGVKQAAEAARTLAKEYRFREVYTSPLSRARVTAKYIAALAHCPLYAEPALKPWDVGKFAGRPVSEVLPAMKKLVAQPDVPAPEGETFRQFSDRFLTSLVDILGQAKRKNVDICVVSHTRNLQLCKAWLAAGAKRDLTYDPKAVNDYTDEVGTGDWLTMRAA